MTAQLLVEETAVLLEREGNELSAVIPGELVNPPYIRYTIMVKTSEGAIITSPEYKVNVIAKEELIEFITPMPYESVKDKMPDILILFNATVNPDSVTIMLDDSDITEYCEITSFSVYYKPSYNLDVGEHTIKVALTQVTEANCSFTILATIYANGYVRSGLRYAHCEDTLQYEYLPYDTGYSALVDMYISAAFYPEPRDGVISLILNGKALIPVAELRQDHINL